MQRQTPVRAYIGLGGNLGDPLAQLRSALSALDALPDTRLVARSSFYRSQPLGGLSQNEYTNAVAALDTGLDPLALLKTLQAIEQEHGRERGPERWASRTLDLDILLYGESRIDDPLLTVPHPGIMDRDFVLVPLYEIAPELAIPGMGRLAILVAACPERGLQRLDGA